MLCNAESYFMQTHPSRNNYTIRICLNSLLGLFMAAAHKLLYCPNVSNASMADRYKECMAHPLLEGLPCSPALGVTMMMLFPYCICTGVNLRSDNGVSLYISQSQQIKTDLSEAGKTAG